LNAFGFSVKIGRQAKIGVTKICAFEYGIGRGVAWMSPGILPGLGAGIAALLVGMTVPAIGAEPQHGERAITCTNVASGTNWQIRIDYDKGTVDSNPANISDRQISWHDASDGGNYTLDRKTAKLTVVGASSTGGYFLYHRCQLEN
jgi:hypothetical protein